MMALGAALYGIGFSMYGFANRYLWFLLAMMIITVGEMIVEPISQAIVALLAPQDMRGRYMAISGLSWLIPSAIGPFIAGLIMDNYDPRWVWYLCGLLSLVAVSGYLILNTRFQKRVSEQSVLVGISTDAA
jgi:MFS family permease